MNHRIILNLLGKLVLIEGICMLLPVLTGAVYREREAIGILAVAVITIIAGLLLQRVKAENRKIRAREGFVITGLSWVLLSLIGAVPFLISGAIPHFTDAVFESASGFTTTGASVLPDPSILPRCVLLWRSFTHWIGGMGILMFMLLFIPSNADEIHIMRAESPGPSVEKMTPRIRESARILYAIYTAMTVLLILALIVSGMPVFDSVCHAFGTAGTGGFGVRADSLAGYSAASQNIITVGMLLFGVNFGVYVLLLRRKFEDLKHAEEVLWYFLAYLAAVALVTAGTLHGVHSAGQTLQSAFFQVASVMTTTGYSTVDFGLWAELPQAVLVLVMFLGACAGSTGGGMKVSRWILYIKQIFRELRSYTHPNSVRAIKLDGRVVGKETLRAANVYLMAYVAIFVLSFLLVSFDRFDLATTFTSVAATINNIGPGLGDVGPAGNYAGFHLLSKWTLIFDMIAGRLELIPILVLLTPNTWLRK